MRLKTAACFCLLIGTSLAFGESKNPADYPLRIHIFGRSETTFYRYRGVDDAQGDGRANLFDGNDVHGVDFNFNCDRKLRASFGFETYPARWKKPGRELVVLFPVFGKAGAYWTCDLNTDVKSFVYFRHNGMMGSEPEPKFLNWMARHDYDPVHGKDVPVQPGAENPSEPSVPKQ